MVVRLVAPKKKTKMSPGGKTVSSQEKESQGRKKRGQKEKKNY
jgi:hypothetical protein